MRSWRDGPANRAIVDFVAQVTGADGSEPVPVDERDYGWLGKLMDEHYAGDDSNVRILAAGVLAAHDGISVEAFEAQADAFLRSSQHPTLSRGYLETAYRPMIELLDYLTANGFTNFIVSGGGRDFMRPITQDVYGIPRERVIGSAVALTYTSDDHGGTITRRPEADYLDDGEREFAYTTGAEQALEQAAAEAWTVVSVKNDWASVF